MSRRALHLMRHGEPQLTGRMLGHLDIPATDAGIRACALRGSPLRPLRIVSSDLQRAQACAAALGAFDIDARWRELDFGRWDGLAAADIDPDALGAFWEDPDACPPPGGERWSDLVARVRDALESLPPEPVLVVSHAGAMRAALQVLMGLSFRQCWHVDLPYVALLSFQVGTEPLSGQLTGLQT